MQKAKRKIKNFILKGITTVAVIVLILSMCAADSESYLPMVTMALSLAWITPFAIANNWGGY